MGKGSEFIAAGPGSVLDVLPQILLIAFMHVLQQNPPPALAVSAGDRDNREKAHQESWSIPGKVIQPTPQKRRSPEKEVCIYSPLTKLIKTLVAPGTQLQVPGWKTSVKIQSFSGKSIPRASTAENPSGTTGRGRSSSCGLKKPEHRLVVTHGMG